MELADGDTLIFLGDSITHQCLYTQYVEDYYYTRYPHIRINIRNAGVGADIAANVLVRFDEDVARFKPKYVTVLIGMNDGHYTEFDHNLFKNYEGAMARLLDKIADINATAILITPTMYDLRSALLGKNWVKPEDALLAHYNAVLAYYGAWVREQANQRGLGFVDMYGPLNRATRDKRRTEPAFSMFSDAVHPDPNAHLIMALALLEDTGAKQCVSSIYISRDSNKWIAEAENGTIKNTSGKEIRFTFVADSLPWVVPNEAQQGYKQINAGHKISREIIQATGLASGDYQFKIDKKTVGTYNHLQFAAGVELQDNNKTPQYGQAMKIAMLNKQRNEQAVRPMRDLWEQLKNNRKMEKVEPEKFNRWRAEFDKKVAALQEKAEQFEDKIYQLNKPQLHKYEIVPVQ